MAQCYEIRLLGQAGDLTTVAFSDLVVIPEPRTTLLRGRFVDQAALHGVLARCRDLGVEIIEVRAVPTLDGEGRQASPLPDQVVSAPHANGAGTRAPAAMLAAATGAGAAACLVTLRLLRLTRRGEHRSPPASTP